MDDLYKNRIPWVVCKKSCKRHECAKSNTSCTMWRKKVMNKASYIPSLLYVSSLSWLLPPGFVTRPNVEPLGSWEIRGPGISTHPRSSNSTGPGERIWSQRYGQDHWQWAWTEFELNWGLKAAFFLDLGAIHTYEKNGKKLKDETFMRCSPKVITNITIQYSLNSYFRWHRFRFYFPPV